MLVVDLHTNKYSDVDEREAFAMQLRGTHKLVHTSAKYSLRYAKHILCGPFPLGEPAIANDAKSSYWYALDALKQPFPLGEAAIATHVTYADWYSEEFNLKLINGVFQPC